MEEQPPSVVGGELEHLGAQVVGGNEAAGPMIASNMQLSPQQGAAADTNSKEPLPYDDHKLFVGGLNWDTTEYDLKEYFAAYGTVTDASLKMDQYTGRSKGYAFIVFQEADAVDKILSAGPHTIGGKVIDSKKAIPHAVHQQLKNKTKKIFVGGVPTSMTEETISEHFVKYGEIEEVVLVYNDTKERREFIFVIYKNEDSVDGCCAEPYHNISGTAVEVKKAIPRDKDAKRSRGGGGGRGRSGDGRGYGGPPRGYGSDWSAPYGGYAAYYPPPPAAPYQDYYHRDGPGYYGSRYGPKKTYGGGHYSHNGPSYHPYSR